MRHFEIVAVAEAIGRFCSDQTHVCTNGLDMVALLPHKSTLQRFSALFSVGQNAINMHILITAYVVAGKSFPDKLKSLSNGPKTIDGPC